MIEPYITLYKEHHSVGKHSDEKVRAFIDSLLRNNSPKILAYMNCSYNRDHIQIISTNLQKGFYQIQQTVQCHKEVKMIHSGFSAGKLENQNGPTKLASDIPIFSNYAGVTL